MFKRLIAWLLTGMLGLAYADSALAYFHLWRINEIYSNATGTVQFVELICAPSCASSETLATLAPITVTPTGGSARIFNFPSDLTTAPVLNQTLLLSTQGFANLGIVTPDFIIPDGFLALGGGSVNLGGFDIVNHAALPTDGILSVNRSGVTATNSPKNFAGATGTISPPVDTQAPTVPTSLSATAVSGSQINLSWTASTDNVGVTAYQVLRGGVFLTTVNAPTVSFSDTGLTVSTTYSYAVRACDAAGNCSAQSNSASATAQNPPDTQPPTVPAGLTATAVSGSQINLTWIASTDNVGVMQYRIYRDAAVVAVLVLIGTPPALSYSSTGLTALTAYSYTVAACDAFANCSEQSAQASATTLAAGQFAYIPLLETGFNLISNALNVTLGAAATFGNQDAPVSGVTPNIVSVWKWNAVDGRWAFYSPQLTVAAIASFAASKNYEVLSTINPGEGYWVNAIGAMTLPTQTGTAFNWAGFGFTALTSGFNLIAHATPVTPSQFNTQVSITPPGVGVIPTDNFVSLWAWDAVQTKWYFYSPLLESSGGLAAVKSYADSHFFLHFQDSGKTLGIGTGFWVNRP